MTTVTTTLICPATWDGPNHFPTLAHRCDRPLDHRGDHECVCQAQAPQCGAEYQPERRDPTARIVRCDRVAGHDGDHEELFTMVTWPQTNPTRDAVRIVARRVLAHIIAATEVDQRWQDYPDIGEDDWAAVAADVRRLADRGDVQHEHYEAAYRHLADRADRSAA